MVECGHPWRRLRTVLGALKIQKKSLQLEQKASAEEGTCRVSSWPLGDPIVYDTVLPGEDQPGVSPDEAAFFKENGFLVKVSVGLRCSLL